MPKRVTIAEVAEVAGVHKGTVSRALNPATADLVNAATLDRIRRAVAELGYVPNVVARGLRTSSSMTVGVLVPDLTNPIFPPIARGIEAALSPRGYTALLANTDLRDSLEQAAFASLIERRVDGFIVATGRVDQQLLEDAYARDVRVVQVNRATPGVRYPLVAGDDGSGVRAAVDHLVALGHRRLVHLAGPSRYTTTLDRNAAFSDACDAAGVAHRTIAADSLTIEEGIAAMARALDGDPFTAVVAGNDLLALGALRTLRARGLECPADVSVVGFNDTLFAEDFRPPLTTVRVPFHEMGAEAARILLAQIDADEHLEATIRLPVELVVRESTGPAPA